MKKILQRSIILSFLVLLLPVMAGCKNSPAEEQNTTTSDETHAQSSSPSPVKQLEMLDMLERVEQLDKLDFQDELTQLNECLRKYDITCAREHLKGAGRFVQDKNDNEQLLAARGAIKGTQLLIEAGKYLSSESFSSAKDRIQQAQAVQGNAVLATLVQKTEDRYKRAYTAYTAEKERQRRIANQRRMAAQQERERSVCRNPRLDSMGFGGGYYVKCGSSSLGRVIDMGSGKWSWWCLSTDYNDSHLFYSSREAMRDLVISCDLK